MNPEIEAEKAAINLNYLNQCFNAVVAELAAARIEIRQIRAKLPPEGVTGTDGPSVPKQ